MLRDASDTDDSFSTDEDKASTSGGTRGLVVVEGDGDTPAVISVPTDTLTSATPPASGEKEEEKKEEEDSPDGGTTEEDTGDPEMAPIYLKRLLPVFTELFHSSLAPPLRLVINSRMCQSVW